jgi:hypothetical protein
MFLFLAIISGYSGLKFHLCRHFFSFLNLISDSKNSKEYLHRAQPSASQPHSGFVWYHRLVPIQKHNVAGSICLLFGQNEMVAKKRFN